jgi:dienelactone hydrolase
MSHMRRSLARLALLAGLLAIAAPAVAKADPVEFSTTYSSFDSVAGCTSPHDLPGYAPGDGARHPVFIYVHGYTGDYASEWRIIAQEAARLGFVAGSPRYTSPLSVSRYAVEQHANCIFGAGPDSALSQLCARPDADCSKGVVVSGLSLGATIASRAANVSPNVRAAYIIGTFYGFETYMDAPPAGTRALPNDRLRITFGQRSVNNYNTMNAVTGRNCATQDCLAADGSGWYAVQDSQVYDGVADHCFHFYSGGCYGQEEPFDPGWRPPSTNPWALDPALLWLKGFTSA